ncbi:hypothetical protein L9G16_19850, partial [Shewanella sp. A25]|nr:hypothetical protein [Shewanella shenzhenensis]
MALFDNSKKKRTDPQSAASSGQPAEPTSQPNEPAGQSQSAEPPAHVDAIDAFGRTVRISREEYQGKV